MRIALLSAEFPPHPGGIGDYTYKLGAALVARGHELCVLTLADCRLQIIDLNCNRQSAIGNLQSSAWNWHSWPAVIAALDAVRPDVLHIQYQTGAYGMHPAINFLPWRLHGLLGRPRVVVTAHDLLEPYLFPKAGRLRRYVTQRILRDADAVVVTNQADAEAVDWGLGETRRQGDKETRRQVRNLSHSTFHIPIGSNIAVAPPAGYWRSEWRAQIGMSANEMLIAYFGLLGRSKGVDTLLAALALLPTSLRLVIIGGEATAPEDRAYAELVRSRIAALGLESRVTITGQVEEQFVSAYLLAADLVALPFADGASFRRGSLLAALAHGVAVVTTRGRGSGVRGQGQLVDGENVLLVPPGDGVALAQAIGRLAADANLRARLGAAGQALAAHFSWPSIAEQHEQLYQQALSSL